MHPQAVTTSQSALRVWLHTSPAFCSCQGFKNENHMSTMGVLSALCGKKGSAAMLFNCVHSAARQPTRLYCKHCIRLFQPQHNAIVQRFCARCLWKLTRSLSRRSPARVNEANKRDCLSTPRYFSRPKERPDIVGASEDLSDDGRDKGLFLSSMENPFPVSR